MPVSELAVLKSSVAEAGVLRNLRLHPARDLRAGPDAEVCPAGVRGRHRS